jgi:hypothetical protein
MCNVVQVTAASHGVGFRAARNSQGFALPQIMSASKSVIYPETTSIKY